MAKIVFISRSKPQTDPRFQYLSELIKISLPHAELIYLTQALLNPKAQKPVTWLTRIYELFQLSLSGKVKLIIYNDTDLKPLILLIRIFFGIHCLYDQQENTVQNFIWNGRYRGFRLSTLLWITRLLDRLRTDTLHLVAEKVYVRELSLQNHRNLLLLENLWFDHLHIQQAKLTSERPFSALEKFLIAGTLGPHYGTLDAVHWHLDQIRKGVRQTLAICGYAPWPAFRKSLLEQIQGDPTITLTNSIDHSHSPETLYRAMQATDCLLLPYHLNGATENRIPSKLREAIALDTTVAITANPAWERILASAPGRHFLIEKTNSTWSFYTVDSTLSPEKTSDLEGQTARLLEALRGVFGV